MMFHVTRPQSTLFLVIIAVMVLLLLMLPSMGHAEPEDRVQADPVGQNLLAALTTGKIVPTETKTPAALADIKPSRVDWYAKSGQRMARPTETEDTTETEYFFDINREITVDTDTVKGSAGLQINW